ncbi:MAG: tRNA (adenosine(37)-N6)-threonylcarbamoyltransferase complex ATPase subunit type 1 TsaE [Bernardetiaceae bacterium]
MKSVWIAESVAGWSAHIPEILAAAKGTPVWLFEGEMGAGKTTLIRQLGAALGVEDPIQSPTFGLVHEYERPNGDLIFHFDFYRIAHPSEALEIGWEEYLNTPNALCWVEWPQRIASLWPDQYVSVHLQMGKHPNQRTLTLSCHE